MVAGAIKANYLACWAFALVGFAIGGAVTSSVHAQNASATKAQPVPPAKGLPKKPNKATPVEILVVDPNDEPVPYAEVELRAKFRPDATWVLNGTHEKQRNPGSSVYKADADGRLVLLIPTKANPYFYIEMNGYRPYYAPWESSDPPRSFTMKLDAARAIGGTVVDEAGNPIVGATISPGVTFKSYGDIERSLYVGREMKTNDKGRWFYGQVPLNLENLNISIQHPSYKNLSTLISVEGFSMKNGLQPSAKVVMEKGLAMRGRITDSNGQPIENAVLRTRSKNVQTDVDGRYELPGCEVGKFRIVIDSPGQAMRIEDVDFNDSTKSHDFTMQPGNKLRIRVVDENDKPVPKAWVYFQKWKGDRVQYFEFDHLKRQADESGFWEWNEAPAEELSVDIGAPNGAQFSEQPVTAREEEYVFKTVKATVVVGQVVDAETKAPIDEFRAMLGIEWEQSGGRVTWQSHQVIFGRDGKFEFSLGDANRKNSFRFEADGYVDLISEQIPMKPGRVPMVFEMKRGVDLEFRILSPDKKPIADATVVLGSEGDQIMLRDGVFDDNSTFARFKKTDQEGRVRYPQPAKDFQLVIAHEAGYAIVRSDAIPTNREIVLAPWAEIEGVYRRGGQAVPNEKLSVYSNELRSGNIKELYVHSNHNVVTGPDGRFRISRLFPGQVSISRELMRVMNYGTIGTGSSYQINVVAEAGKTARADFEGDGARIVGQLAFPKGAEQKEGWTYCTLSVIIRQPRPTLPSFAEMANISPEIAQKRLVEWMQTAAGKVWQTENERWTEKQRTSRNHQASIDRDGKFVVEDIVPGDYVLSIQFWQGDRKLQLSNCQPTVTEEDSTSRREIDLGRLELEPIEESKSVLPFNMAR